MKVNPENGNLVKVDVFGYGCESDCQEYFPRVDGEGCGWKDTDNTWPLW